MKGPVLITGAFGYVGGRLAQALSGRGWKLRLGSRRRTAEPKDLRNAEVVRLDILSEGDLKAACRGAAAVVHLASADENESAADPARALEVNGLGTLKTLRAAIEAGVPRLLYFSTAHVYGAPLRGRLSETNATRPIHPYAITHAVAEDFVLAARTRGEISGLVVRLSNGIGAPAWPDTDRWTLLGNDLCRQAVTTRRLVLRSPGLQRRDFIALSDVAAAAAHLLRLPDGRCGDGLFNLGGGTSMRVLDLARRIAARCGRILGFVPPLSRPQPARSERSLPLDYRIDKLKSTGFRLQGDIDAEIDATLRFCAESSA